MAVPRIADLADQLFELIAGDFDKTFRTYLSGSDVVQTENYLRIQTGLGHPFANLMITRELRDAKLLRNAIQPLCSDDFPSAIACLGPLGLEAEKLLGDHDFNLAEVMPAMAIDLRELNAVSSNEKYSVEEIGPEQHELWVDAMAEGYELPRPFTERFGPAVVSSIAEEGVRYRYFIAFCEEQPVATAVNITRNGIVGVYCIATVPEHRGCGVGTLVTAAPLRIAQAEGYETAILQASTMGKGVYTRLGFEEYGGIPIYVRAPAT